VTRGGALLCGAVAVLAAAAIGGAGGGGARGPTVVAVGEAPRVATGFTVAPGRVVTVGHVLDAGTVTVRGPDGTPRTGTVIRRDERLDLAVVAVPGLPGGPAPLGAGTRVLVRRDGAIAALPATVIRRIDARVRQAGTARVARRPAVELDARVAAGDSGAPVVHDGRVTGIVFARSSRDAGVAYAVDAVVLGALVR
jgi:hypothetical protein